MENKLEPEKLARVKQILETDKFSSPLPPKKIGSKLLGLLSSPYLKISLTLVFFLLIFTTTFVIAHMKMQKQQQTSDQNIVPESEIVLPATNQNNEGTNQKTYTNSKYNFSFEYPENWIVGENSLNSIFMRPADIETFGKPDYGQIHIIVDTTNMNLDSFIETRCDAPNVCATPEKAENLVVANFPAKKLVNPPAPVSSELVMLKKENQIYSINVDLGDTSTKSEYLSYFNQVLSTFKFLDSEVQGITISSNSCLDSEKIMLEEIGECEVVNEKMCLEFKKKFDSCVLACLKDLKESNACFTICKPVCNTDETGRISS